MPFVSVQKWPPPTNRTVLTRTGASIIFAAFRRSVLAPQGKWGGGAGWRIDILPDVDHRRVGPIETHVITVVSRQIVS